MAVLSSKKAPRGDGNVVVVRVPTHPRTADRPILPRRLRRLSGHPRAADQETYLVSSQMRPDDNRSRKVFFHLFSYLDENFNAHLKII